MSNFTTSDMSYLSRMTIKMSPADRDNYIEWMWGKVFVRKYYKTTAEEHNIMQRQFTIELRVDFADPGKLEALKQTLQQAARHTYATAQLLSDTPKTTQIAIYSDDFFTGHETIALLDDTIQQGLDAIGSEESGDTGISSELLGAMNGVDDEALGKTR